MSICNEAEQLAPLVAALKRDPANVARVLCSGMDAEFSGSSRQVTPKDSLPFYQTAIAIYEATLGAECSELVSPLVSLMDQYKNLGRYADAEAAARRAAQIRRQRGGSSYSLSFILDQHAEILKKLRRFEDAELALFEAFSALEPDSYPRAIDIARTYADVLEAAGRRGVDAEIRRFCRELREGKLSPESFFSVCSTRRELRRCRKAGGA